MKIVETNIIYNGLILHDHQTRVLEIPSWEEYCDLFKYYDGTSTGANYRCIYNQLIGNVLPNNATILSLKIDEFHLTCDLGFRNEETSYKLAYIIER